MLNVCEQILFPISHQPFSERLEYVHNQIRRQLEGVARLSISLYDADTDLIKTYAHSGGAASPLRNYQTRLSEVAGLRRIAESGVARVVDDISRSYNGDSDHTVALRESGYRSSYTVPILSQRRLYGFVFINSLRPAFFTEEVVGSLNIYISLIAHMVVGEMKALQILSGSISVLTGVSRYRDPETAEHLKRMSHFSHLIARGVATSHGLDDDYVEHLLLFAPLHDIGKVGIPDAILLKQGRLTVEEFEVMKRHATIGADIVEQVLIRHDLDEIHHASLLRNIVRHHHEKMDGSGYPDGLHGEEIPLEARIVAVADVFDALTSRRPYKPAWSNHDALAWMRSEGGNHLDQALVAVLARRQAEVLELQQRFADVECDAVGIVS